MNKIEQIKNMKEEQVKKLVKLRKGSEIICIVLGFIFSIFLLLSIEIHFSILDPLTGHPNLFDFGFSIALLGIFGGFFLISFLVYNHLNYKLNKLIKK